MPHLPPVTDHGLGFNLEIAPEVLAKKGYTYTIDWWSLGVCAYELVFGRRPFRGKTNSDLTQSIARDQLRFPDDAETKCSREGILALSGVSESGSRSRRYVILSTPLFQLLERDPSRRLGCKPRGDGFEELKKHPWFRTIMWETLEDKEAVSPFIPDVSPRMTVHRMGFD